MDSTTQTVLIRDAYTCQLRLPGCDRYATMTAPKDTGRRTTQRAYRPAELIAVCRDCAATPTPTPAA